MLLWMFNSLARFSDVVNFRLAGCWTCVRSTIGSVLGGTLGHTYNTARKIGKSCKVGSGARSTPKGLRTSRPTDAPAIAWRPPRS